VNVTPIWTADRNRLESPRSFATARPRPPRSASAVTWPGRSATSAISAAAKNPPTSTNTSTSAMFSATSTP